MKAKKIYVIAGIHGNESFGLKVLARLQEVERPNIFTRIANLEAVSKRKRFIEVDLNRSFLENIPDSKEARLAAAIKREIQQLNPDLIIDLHTSTVKIGKVAIIAQKNTFTMMIAKQMDMKHAALMPVHISKKSLLGVCPEKSVCIELGKGLRSDGLAQEVANKIVNLTKLQEPPDSKLPLLVVERIISKKEATGLNLCNYVYNEELKGYPFLTGETNYKEHRGFLATSLVEV